MSTRQNDVMRVQRAERADCTRDCAPSVGPTARLRSFVPFKPAVVVAVCHRGTLTFVRRLRVDAFYANRGEVEGALWENGTASGINGSGWWCRAAHGR